MQEGMKENKWKSRQSDENLQGPAIKGEKEKRGTLLLPSPAAAAKMWVFPLCIRSAWGRCKPFAGSLEFPHTKITLSIPHYCTGDFMASLLWPSISGSTCSVSKVSLAHSYNFKPVFSSQVCSRSQRLQTPGYFFLEQLRALNIRLVMKSPKNLRQWDMGNGCFSLHH